MYADGGVSGKRALLLWHRRAGKDNAALNFTAVETQRKVANYWHMFPEQKQGRKALWEGVNPHTGIKFIDQAFPKEMRASKNDTEMMLRFKNGSTWQVVGSDTYDSNVGTTPYGIILSEWALANPAAWEFIRPILLENGGWAIFPYTPRGKNHGWRLYEMAKDNLNWFCEKLTIEDTFREDGTRIFTDEMYQNELAEGMDPLLARQEYYCSFDAGLMGAYYTEQLKLTRIGDYPWNPMIPVHTFWDIGLSDATSIWFGQKSFEGDAINIIDFESQNNIPFVDWISRINQKPYNYGMHYMPHDFKKRDWKDGKSAHNVAMEFGFDYEEVPNISINEGIDAVKMFLPRLRFNNSPEVMQGFDALTNYRREYNQKLQVFMNRPLHDWASHPSDAMRYMAIGWDDNYQDYGSNHFKVIPAIGRR
ncbi:MAG: hypothetical protein DWQ49_09970 [Bacteroidetes bacterium]|nr:MAG: hypothetical protein DWQ49_09970 [Bacteroidota bacterium]